MSFSLQTRLTLSLISHLAWSYKALRQAAKSDSVNYDLCDGESLQEWRQNLLSILSVSDKSARVHISPVTKRP